MKMGSVAIAVETGLLKNKKIIIIKNNERKKKTKKKQTSPLAPAVLNLLRNSDIWGKTNKPNKSKTSQNGPKGTKHESRSKDQIERLWR